MTNLAIEFKNLSKTFRSGKEQVLAVDSLNLDIDAGQVYGFLGPNGAGKSTTIRMLMDLVRPSTGTVRIFGSDVHSDPGALRKAGALVEGASFYEYLSGRDNLVVLAHTSAKYSPDRINMLLDQVSLSGRAEQRVRGYSMGMKQRLGIAAALLDDPELVILDEPTNGLDPAGIQEMRVFIRSLAHEHGKTVFLSSHQLGEVEQICDRVAIINEGRIIREGAVTELLSSEKSELHLQVTPLNQAAATLIPRWQVRPEGDWLIVSAPSADAPEIIKHLIYKDLQVHQALIKRQSLEEYFLTATKNEKKNG
ncbi:MAG: ABC transporter ATP-binding protein [Anaerolineae bacterium]|nr:ABC transporter ATP-binding protein [Anaerolineae bacterium]